MSNRGQWLLNIGSTGGGAVIDGFVPVHGYNKADRPPEEVAMMEKALYYGADAVFFEAPQDGKLSLAQAFIYRSDGPAIDPEFAKRHQKLWSWGGVPLVYRVTSGLVQLFRCAHRPDFEKDGEIIFKPFKTLKVAAEIAVDPWWDAELLRNGMLWNNQKVCKELLSSKQAAQKTLVNAVKDLHTKLTAKSSLPKPLQRRLLILSVLIAYLEARKVFEDGFFDRFNRGADKFFKVLANGPALVALLDYLEDRFNGHVFTLSSEDRETLRTSDQLAYFAQLVEARQESNGQLTLWQRYSFADLPVELISHIYQLFVKDTSVSVYTPHFVVRLMVGEILSWERLDRLDKNDEVILDGACGSGIFLVEAYKRIVLHWRYRNNWKRPSQTILKKLLTTRLRGVDLEEGAVELAAFSLCLALCDALEPEEIRASVKLFPALKEATIHTGCFFEVREKQTIKEPIGVVIGNPPFASKLDTDGAQRAHKKYQRVHGTLPDKQLAYLFLHESMEMLVSGGVISMLQQYGFLYNQKSLGFRCKFIERWDVREILDFISVRGIFQKGGADTKVVVIVAEAQSPPPERQILHATFRRSSRTDAEQGFDIDYYDMHWLPRELVVKNDAVWRSNQLGGGRVLSFVDRLKGFETLSQYAEKRGWNYGEGWIEAKRGKRLLAEHITGKPYIPSKHLTVRGIDETKIRLVRAKLFKTYYTEKRFTPPMVMVREHMDFPNILWTKSYLTYTQQIVGFCAPTQHLNELRAICRWLDEFKSALQAYLAATSPRLFGQRATALTANDVLTLPFKRDGRIDLPVHEQILVSDIVDYYRDLIRLGEDSKAMQKPGAPALPTYNDVFTTRINGVYKKNKLRALESQVVSGVVCQAYVFGKGTLDWSGTEDLKAKLDTLLREKRGGGLNVTRIARLYDGACIFLLKPNRLRYWLRSVALRDADETLADLAKQGF